MKTLWKATDTTNARYLGTLEIESPSGLHNFEVLATNSRLVFGGACNAGFLESGYMERGEGESESESLSELQADLEAFYSDGHHFVSRIVVNDRM